MVTLVGIRVRYFMYTFLIECGEIYIIFNIWNNYGLELLPAKTY
jgi:hypothetical protein